MKKVAIIGAGAAGIMCSIQAVSKNTTVVLFDKNPVVGKKLLITGNGRCNYWNMDMGLEHFHSNNQELLKDFITDEVKSEVLAFFDSIGVVPNIKNGYYYPYSNQASSIRDLLEAEARRRGVLFSLGEEVKDIFLDNGKFVVDCGSGLEYFDDLVIATGSKACPKTGSTGFGYHLAEKFGHHVVDVVPALVQLEASGKFLKDWSGIRVQCVVRLYEDGIFLKKEMGEAQLTDYGISGICIFNLSRYVSRGLLKNKKEELKISFLPFLEEKSLEEVELWFKNRIQQLKEYTMVEFLEGILPYKLVFVVLKQAKISRNRKAGELSDEEMDALLSYLMEFPLVIVGTRDFSSCQVCSGGVLLQEVDFTFQSRFVPNLYFVGEVLDVDGDCGGYNLGFSFMSGMAAGKAIRGDKND